jgi:hypothetical protein
MNLHTLFTLSLAYRFDTDNSQGTPTATLDGDLTTEESPTKRSAALFLMKTRNEGRLTQSALNSVVHSTSELCQQVANKLKREFSATIADNEMISEDAKRSLIEQMSSMDYEPFKGISTEYQQEKYYKEHFNYLVCALHNTVKNIGVSQICTQSISMMPGIPAKCHNMTIQPHT